MCGVTCRCGCAAFWCRCTLAALLPLSHCVSLLVVRHQYLAAPMQMVAIAGRLAVMYQSIKSLFGRLRVGPNPWSLQFQFLSSLLPFLPRPPPTLSFYSLTFVCCSSLSSWWSDIVPHMLFLCTFCRCVRSACFSFNLCCVCACCVFCHGVVMGRLTSCLPPPQIIQDLSVLSFRFSSSLVLFSFPFRLVQIKTH